jgi:hypothetical protein
MRNPGLHPALLAVLGIMLVAGSVVTNAILQNGDQYTTWYLLVGIPGVMLIAWNGPKWLQEHRASRK